MRAKPTTIAEYLAGLEPDKRSALERLRKTIINIAPRAEECITYGVPGFRLNGKALVGFGAAAKHCAFFPMNGHMVAEFQDDLKDYDTSKGTIRFLPNKPLPAALVRKLVKARMAEIEGGGKSKKPRTAAVKRRSRTTRRKA